MAIDLRGHTVPADGDGVDFNAINKLSASINDPKTVANMVEADQYLAALTAASLPTAAATIFNTADQKYYGRIGNAWKQFYTTADETNWVTRPLMSGATGVLQSKVKNGICFIEGWINLSMTAGQQTQVLANFPNELRPNSETPLSAAGFIGASGNYQAAAAMNASGNIWARNTHSATISGFRVSGSWPI